MNRSVLVLFLHRINFFHLKGGYAMSTEPINFDILVNQIQQTHKTLQESAVKAINKHLTIRNWLIGFYIIEFEQKGEDRAQYGERLLQNLAERLKASSLSHRNLKLFRQFFSTYPQIGKVISSEFIDSQQFRIGQLAIAQFNSSSTEEIQVPPDKLISRLSYTHLVLLLPIQDSLKRTFYEIEAIKGNWSTEELKRQIGSLYFERSNMSQNPEKLSRIVLDNAEPSTPSDIIKSPFTFEFLGLKAKDVLYESDLEQALIDSLEEFLLELGDGFCFEAKQKRITIDDEYFFIDLVFYHRILKCHVLVELKVEPFKHEHSGQLKTYINYYKKEITRTDDNPPIGILLVTNKNEALVEYALADSDEALFVSKYILELPSKHELHKFLIQELKKF